MRTSSPSDGIALGGAHMTQVRSRPHRLALAAAALTLVAAPSLSWGQAASMAHRMEPAKEGSEFKCQDGKKLFATFTTRDQKLLAVVDAGDGPHELSIRPWDSGDPVITWSDGVRTLTWSVGVQLMLMDGGTHLMCGRGMEHEH